MIEDYLMTYILVLGAVLMTMMVSLLPWGVYMDWKREQQIKSCREKALAESEEPAVWRVRSRSSK